MKYKLIATDIDGTLINDNHTLGEKNVLALKKALDHGIKVVLCSGRSPSTMQQFEEQIGLLTPGNYGIGFNGSTVYDAHNREIIAGQTIPKDKAIQIIETTKKLSDKVKLSLYTESDLLIAEDGLQDVLEQYNQGSSSLVINYYPEITKEHITKDVLNIYLIQYRDILKPIYDAFSKEPISGVTLAFTQKDLLEFMPQSMNKAQGLRALIKHLGLQMDQVVSVGDNYNDIEMIKESGFGVAVSNSVQELKNIADYVTKRDNNKDALEEVVDLVIEMNQ